MIRNPIYDLLTRIKNGQQHFLKSIKVPNIKINLIFLRILYHEKFIKHYQIISPYDIQIWFHYIKNESAISKISFFSTSKPLLTLSLSDLWKVQSLSKLLILRTSKGYLTGKQSKKKKIGGILICSID